MLISRAGHLTDILGGSPSCTGGATYSTSTLHDRMGAELLICGSILTTDIITTGHLCSAPFSISLHIWSATHPRSSG